MAVLCEQDVGQNGLVPFAVPEAFQFADCAEISIDPENSAFQIRHSQCSCLTYERK